ncbi:MAG: glycogen debranching N-terminal domain-containing protein, partial [Actinomycetota bacterium]
MRSDRAPAVGKDWSPPQETTDGVPGILADLATRVLAIKEGDTFLYSDTEGDLDDRKEYGLGLYHRDTRFLSHFLMNVSGRQPVLLSSSAERSYMSHVDLTNPDLYGPDGDGVVPQQTLNIRRTRAIRGRLFERVRVKNYNSHRVQVAVQFSLAADFADVFEVRGITRERRGHQDPPRATEGGAEFGYTGLDGVRRRTLLHLSPAPDRMEVVGDRIEADFVLDLASHQTRLISLTVDPLVEDEPPSAEEFDSAVHWLRRSYEDWERECTAIYTDNEVFNQLLTRGIRDLRALETDVDGTRILAAGIPWYVAVFGRDSLITSHQLLTVNARPARETLRLLAELQGTTEDDWRDEEPGKILHEIRRGELAGAGVIPFTRYYGSVDSTPWFVLLYAQYFRWTGDVRFAEDLLPNV